MRTDFRPSDLTDWICHDPEARRGRRDGRGPETTVELWHHGERPGVGGAPVTRPMPSVPDPGPEPASPPGRRPPRRAGG
ncbi:hypothetical protein FXF53_03595 [Micromonospora sp. WP24]|nr:hypothetical protein FXF53_03595 [Micromonospora sp. WP24]